MKKLLTFIFVMLTAAGLWAQLPAGANAPDFTAKDINGRTWNLYDILESGRPVVMDVSATWCGPCWGYHQSKALETLYDEHGPEGDATLMVLWIEGDPATNLACIYGPSGCSGGTQGNWTLGTSFPIIDDAGIADDYQISYFPTIYVIRPDKTVYEVGQVPATSLWNQASPHIGQIPARLATVNSFDPGTLSTELCGAQSGTPKVQLLNLGLDPITEAVVELRWNGTVLQTKTFTGDAKAFDLMDVEFDPIIVNDAGTLTAEVISVNGQDNAQTASAAVEYVNAPEKFVSQQLKLRVRTDNAGADIYWAMYDETGTIIDHGGNEAVGPDGGGMYPQGAPSHPSAYPNNATIRDTIDIPASGCFTIRFVDGAGNGLAYPGYFRLYEINSAIQFFNSPPVWGAYTGHTMAQITSGVQQPDQILSVDVYPNPATDVLNVSIGLNASVDIRTVITDAAGRIVYTQNSQTFGVGEQQFDVPVSNLAKGLYFLQLQTQTGLVTRRFVVQ